MKIRYFAETDTLHIEFRTAKVAETRDLDENTLLEVDTQGNICAITGACVGACGHPGVLLRTDCGITRQKVLI